MGVIPALKNAGTQSKKAQRLHETALQHLRTKACTVVKSTLGYSCINEQDVRFFFLGFFFSLQAWFVGFE